jgi:tetratricopeptide (TPR) repeat protein
MKFVEKFTTRLLRGAVLLSLVFVHQAFGNQESDYATLVRRAADEYSKGKVSASESSLIAALRSIGPGDDRYRAATLANLATLYVNTEELSKAERAYMESLGIYRRLSDQSNVVSILSNLGGLYALEGRYDDASEVLRQALKTAKANAATNPGLRVQVLNSLGVVYCRQGKFKKAESFFNQTQDLAAKTGISVRTPQFLHNLGVIYREKRDFKKAEGFFTQALKLTEAEVGPSHPDLIFMLYSLGDLYNSTGRYLEAERELNRALTILQTARQEYSTRIARVLYALSVTYLKSDRITDADATMAQAADIARGNLTLHGDMITIVKSYAGTLKRQGKVGEAKQLWNEAERARIVTGLVVQVRGAF